MAEDGIDAFYDFGCQLLDAVFATLYEKAYGTLLQFVKASSSREKSLGHWLNWWNKRKFNWVKAFRLGLCTHNSNLDEHFFSTYKHEQNLSLVDAAYRDIVDAVKPESLIEGLDDSTIAPGSLGKGPLAKTRAERAEKNERQPAAAYAEKIRTARVRSENFARGIAFRHGKESHTALTRERRK